MTSILTATVVRVKGFFCFDIPPSLSSKNAKLSRLETNKDYPCVHNGQLVMMLRFQLPNFIIQAFLLLATNILQELHIQTYGLTNDHRRPFLIRIIIKYFF